MKDKIGRFLIALAVTLGVAIPAVVISPPAHADTYPYQGHCVTQGGFNTVYAYGSGSQAVYAGGWIDYAAAKRLAGTSSTCGDINVTTSQGNAMIVRTQFCPMAGGPQFTCYSMGWGSVNSLSAPVGCFCGTSVHYFHFPSNMNYNWYFRIETLGSSEWVAAWI